MLTRFTDRKLFFPVLNFVAIVATMWALLVIFDKPTSGKSASNRQGSNVLAIVIAIVGVGGGAVSSVVIYKAIAQLQTLDGSLQERTKELNDANAQLRAYNESLAETVSRRTNELLFAELQYRSLFDATAELILICDGKSNALEVNRPVEMFFGCDRNNLRGFNLLEKIHPEDRQRVGDAIVETNRGEIVAEEVRIRSRTGEEQFFLAEFSPLLMDRESIVGFKVLMKDITPEKQNQIEQEVIITISEAMNRSDVINDITQEISYKLKSLFDPSLMNIYRYEPPENMLVACRTLGSESSVSEVTQRYFVDQSSEGVAPQTAFHRKEYFIEDCRRSLLLQYAAAYIQSRNGRSLFSVPMIASGELQGVLQVLTTGSKMLSQDERELIRVVADEIASGFYRKRLTAAIAKANDELGAKNDELENFVSSVSHDLKAPLISIQGYATQIGEQLYESLSQDARFCLERIRYNAKNMEELISDLLDLSRVGRETPVMDDIFIYEMLSGIRENYLQQISGRNITIDIPTELPHVKYPRRRLEQVLTNLFGNAIRYTARVPEPHIKVYATEDEHFYEIVVKDNGIGIDKKSHEKVFRMFERLDISDKSGTGVGLAIVKKVVEQYGGKVWIVSEAGQGAAFHFTIRKQQ